ncbi:MAG: MFS transporter [Hyphomicrobiaceae bacterium]|nr:MFS transporter [Hyphomicrobiaceae bacterium]
MPAPASGRGAIAALAGAFLTQFAAGFGFITFSLLAPSLAVLTGLNERDFGLWVTFFFFGTAVSSPATGLLVRRFGGVWTVALALFAMAAAMLVNLGGSWAITMLAATLYGLAYGPQGPVGMTVVTERTPPSRRGFFLALRHSSQPLAGIIAGRLLPPLMLVVGWQFGIFTTVGVLVAAALFTLTTPALFRVTTVPVAPPSYGRRGISWAAGSVVRALAVPVGLRLLWGAGLVFAVNQIAMIVFSYLYLLEVAKLTPIEAGIFLSNMQIAGLLGRPALGWFCDKTGQSQLVLALLSAIGVATIFALMSVSGAGMPLWQLFILAIACGLSGQTWNAIFTTAMSYKVPPERLAELNGRSFAFLSLGWMAGAPFFWLLIEVSGGYAAPFIVVGAANALAAIALIVSAWRERARA